MPKSPITDNRSPIVPRVIPGNGSLYAITGEDALLLSAIIVAQRDRDVLLRCSGLKMRGMQRGIVAAFGFCTHIVAHAAAYAGPPVQRSTEKWLLGVFEAIHTQCKVALKTRAF
jgi:hypothetical protein